MSPQVSPSLSTFSSLLIAAATVSSLFVGIPAPAQQPDYTIHANTRLVLTDVTVADSQGNPVHNLKTSDFQILDNKTPESIASFEEHTAEPVKLVNTAATAPGFYNNDFMQHLPPSLNILLIDIKNIEIEDQMYLAHRLEHLIASLPAGQPLAFYWCRGNHTIVLQSFTADHALLLAALHKAMPRFPPSGREFLNDFTSLQQIASDVRDLPGRKNILWFTGGSTLYLRPNGDGFQAPYVDQEKIRAVFDELETSRIAIFPIDARGLTIYGANPSDTSIWAQHGQMNDVAAATGGEAFSNDNGLDAIASHLLTEDGSFYTLTYSPKEIQFDNRWHKVEIKFNRDGGPYKLSYRRGYFADGVNANSSQPAKRSNPSTRALLGGGSVESEDSGSASSPILFEVSIHPAQSPAASGQRTDVTLPFDPSKQKRGTETYSLLYSVPLKDFDIKTVNGKSQASLGIALIAFNDDGSVTARASDQVSVFVHPDKFALAPNTAISVQQKVNLPRGEDSVYCAVWDTTSHRLGTIRVPVSVSKNVASQPATP